MPTVTLNGHTHYYEETGSGEPLFMLHGAMGSGHNFDEHVALLSKKMRVIVVDMRGMGRSEHVTEMEASAWTDDQIALQDHLGIQRAHIFGTSLGARIATRMAIFNKDRVASVILNSPHNYLTPELNEAQNQGGGDGRNFPAARQADLERRHGADWLDVVRNYFNIRNNDDLQEYYNFKPNLHEIEAPTLTIAGDTPGHTFDHAIEVWQRVKGAHLAVVPAIAEAGSPYGRQSTEVICQIVADFVLSAAPVATAR